MRLPLYQVDAFARNAFEGNPAAVVPLDEWIDDEIMQSIAQENNLAETAFFVKEGNAFHIRWFTPNKKEVSLCGHATLASAFVLFEVMGYPDDTIHFTCLAGNLKVVREGALITMDFPSQPPEPCETYTLLEKGLGVKPLECLQDEDILVRVESEVILKSIEPNHDFLIQLPLRGVMVTAPSEQYDFVSRFFAPKYGIPEDSVTGSSFTKLTPYWAAVLGKAKLKARQVSERGGDVFTELKGDRVTVSGHAVLYLKGEIHI